MGGCSFNKHQQQDTRITFQQQKQNKQYAITQQIEEKKETEQSQQEQINEFKKFIKESQEQQTAELKKFIIDQLAVLQNKVEELEKRSNFTPFSSDVSYISKKNEIEGQIKLYQSIYAKKKSKQPVYCQKCLEILNQYLQPHVINGSQIEQINSSQESNGQYCQFLFHSILIINQENISGNQSKQNNQNSQVQQNLHYLEISKMSQYNQEEQKENQNSSKNSNQ